MKWIWSG